MKMNYANAVEVLKNKIKNNLSEKETIFEKKVFKNNVTYTGISLTPDTSSNEEGKTVARAVIYLEVLMAAYYENDKSLDEIADEAVKLLRLECSEEINTTIERNRIFAKLVNTQANEKYLKELPHRDFLDLSVIYYAEMSANGVAIATITNELAEKYDLTENDLYEAAMANMTPSVTSMFDTLCELLESNSLNSDNELVEPDALCGMYVITNKSKKLGASSLLCSAVTERVAALLGGSYYVLPSSIHEVLALADNAEIDKEGLVQMVRDVNTTEVAPDEILSYSVYYYNAETKKVEIAVKKDFY